VFILGVVAIFFLCGHLDSRDRQPARSGRGERARVRVDERWARAGLGGRECGEVWEWERVRRGSGFREGGVVGHGQMPFQLIWSD
jgi:hypothetical protein